MVLALLDELPCIIDEADELMTRISQLAATVQPETDNQGVEIRHPQSVSRSSSSLQTDQSESVTTHSESSGEEQHSSGVTTYSAALSPDSLEATIKFFGKHFLLVQPVAVDKLKAALPPAESPERESLRALASRGYHLMKHVHHWQENAWDTLTRHLEEAVLLTFDNHRRIAELLLDAVVRYVKLNLLWSSLNSIPGLLSLHGFFQYLHVPEASTGRLSSSSSSPSVFSQLDHTDHRVREFVLCFGTNALLKIQQDFARHPNSATLASALVALLRSSLPRWLRCYDLTELRNRGVFDVDTLYQAGGYASHPAFLDITDTASVPEWVLCVALCVPHYLKVSPDLALNGSDGFVSETSAVAINVTLWEAVQVVLGDRLMLVVHRDHTVNAHGLVYQQVMSCTTAMAVNTHSIGQPPPPPARKEFVAFGKHALLSCGERRHQRREIVAHLLTSSIKLLRHNAGLAGPLFPMLTAALTLGIGEIEWLLAHTSPSTASAPPLLPSFLKAKHWQRARFPDHTSELCTLLALTHRLRALVSQSLEFVTPYYRAFLAHGDADAIAHSIQTLSDKQAELGVDDRVIQLLQSFRDRSRFCLEPEPGPSTRRHSNPTNSDSSWVREWQQTAAFFATARLQLPIELRARIELACKHVEFARADADNLLERAADFSKAWWFRHSVERSISGSTNAADTSAAILDLFGRFVTGDKRQGGKCNAEDADATLFQLASGICEQSTFNPTLCAQITRLAVGKCASELLQRIVLIDRAATTDSDKVKRSKDNSITLSLSFEAAACAWKCLRQTARHHFAGIVDCESLLAQILARESQPSVSCAGEGSAKTRLALALSPHDAQTTMTLVDKLACFFVALVTQRCLPTHTTAASNNGDNSKQEAAILIASPKLQRFVYASPAVRGSPQSNAMAPGAYTSLEALGSLVKLVGRSGVQSISTTLVELLCEQIHALRLSLELEEAALVRVEHSLQTCATSRDVADAVHPFPSADELASQLTRIGVTTFVLQLLDRALCASGDWELQVHRACFSSPAVGNGSKRPAWRRLPAACAAMLSARVWRAARMVPDAAAADSNVHMAGMAIALLLRRSLAASADAETEDQPCAGCGLSTVETARHVGHVVRSCALVVLALEQSEPLALQRGSAVGCARALALEIALQELGTTAAPDWTATATSLDRGMLREWLVPHAI